MNAYCIDHIANDVYQKQWLITVNDNLIEYNTERTQNQQQPRIKKNIYMLL